MKTEILKVLRESGGYVSGQQLCDSFGVSRTAVWKVIEQLKKEGYEIEAVRNKGYRLIESPDLMGQAELESLIDTRWAGKTVVYAKETDSTNIQAKALGEKGAVHGTLVVADRQTAGKGRRGRRWTSPPGTSIYMTILLKPQFLPSKAPMLTLVMALSVAEGIKGVTGLPAQIKWPNDIVVNGKKVCGILTEMSAEVDYINYVVTGAGVNVNTDSFPEEIARTATSLYIEGGSKLRRAKLAARIVERYEKNYEMFLETEDLSRLKDTYNRLLVNCRKEVRILEPGNEYEAIASGIDDTGELIVTTEDGKEKAIYAGEVSVRGVYGYV
ncbi:biotin--[acetyl-CoA-carboxylase] ligase [Extibacter muris]|uniref:biotin--[acetyl-CoA-carboxylase] ligase n=1 Tax=Extibacter muris TaxID=1796622 RepID=UPI001D07DC0E|nr:biotin--[acetyl-CoA-carboxylase] ligase [Extibacter muris]MCB6201505.1 biotin--[acetyl-CoA-carboxylase] ligase [Extibacter muris]MCQ4662831.1 biotin--[acetyl-CoA-carboxylase] ligase [Extibacter muris]MCQ4692754.1 biotin--[acetyl-CoA-carboxylase] ligase [Extibacter muris]